MSDTVDATTFLRCAQREVEEQALDCGGRPAGALHRLESPCHGQRRHRYRTVEQAFQPVHLTRQWRPSTPPPTTDP